MLATTILINEAPRCVVRPTDNKDLVRFIRNGKSFLLAGTPDGKITHRNATETEFGKMARGPGAAQSVGRLRRGFFRGAVVAGLQPKNCQGRPVPASCGLPAWLRIQSASLAMAS